MTGLLSHDEIECTNHCCRPLSLSAEALLVSSQMCHGRTRVFKQQDLEGLTLSFPMHLQDGCLQHVVAIA